MANTPTTTMRINPELKTEAMNVLEPLGLSLSGAVSIFLKAVVREQGLPFDLHAKELSESISECNQTAVSRHDSMNR
jgi:DNA-damage-inducible protein J